MRKHPQPLLKIDQDGHSLGGYRAIMSRRAQLHCGRELPPTFLVLYARCLQAEPQYRARERLIVSRHMGQTFTRRCSRSFR
jgi:hypothetical protein